MSLSIGEIRRRQEAMELLVGDLTRGDNDNVPATVRVAIERGWSYGFTDTLVGEKKKKEAEIDRICYRHYSDFLNSVREIVRMKSSARELDKTSSLLKTEFERTGEELCEVLTELENLQLERENTRKVLESMAHCQELTELMYQARCQIDSQDHYAAMHIIERIQKEQTKETAKPLTRQLSLWLNKVVEQVWEVARKEADEFLSEGWGNASLFGNIILCRQAKLSSKPTGLNTMHLNSNSGSGPSLSSSSSSNKITYFNPYCSYQQYINCSPSLQYIIKHYTTFHLETWSKRSEFEGLIPVKFLNNNSEEDGDDIAIMNNYFGELSPLHRALYTCHILGEQERFHTFYQGKRTPELSSYIEGASKAAARYGLAKILPTLTANIIGFFSVEVTIARAVERPVGAFAWTEIAHLWDEACGMLNELCTNFVHTLQTSEELLVVKEELLLLADTVSDDFFDLKSHAIYSIMANLWSAFEALQLTAIAVVCRNTLLASSYEPLKVTNEAVFQQEIRAFRLDAIQYDTCFADNDCDSEHSTAASSDEDETPDNRNSLPNLNLNISGNNKSSGNNNNNNNGNDARRSRNLRRDSGASDTSVGKHQRQPSHRHRKHSASATNLNNTSGNSSSSNNNSNMHEAALNLDALEEFIDNDSRTSYSNANANGADKGGNGNNNNNNSSSGSGKGRRSIGGSTANGISSSEDGSLLMSSSFSRAFPFSKLVPIVMKELHYSLVRYFVFAHRNMQLPSPGEFICQSIYYAIDVVGSQLIEAAMYDGAETPISKVCQISIDASSLAVASDTIWSVLESALALYRWNDVVETALPQAISSAKLLLSRISLQSQEFLLDLLSQKIDDLISLFSSTPLEPTSPPMSPHNFVLEIIRFLETTFMCLTHLPPSARETALFSCCDRISNGIIDYVINCKKKFNVYCLVTLQMDYKKLESFAESCRVPNLIGCFADDKDLIEILLISELPYFMDNIVQLKQHYPRMDLKRLLALMEKLVPLAVNSGSASNIRLDKNSLPTMIKKLRAYLSTPQASIASSAANSPSRH